jgi:hypothetical protein
MKFKIHKTDFASVGIITLVIDRTKKIVFDPSVEQLPKDQVELLNVFKDKTGNFYPNSQLIRLVRAGRLEIKDDKQLSALFGKDLPEIVAKKKAAEPKPATMEELTKQFDLLQSQILALKKAESENKDAGETKGAKGANWKPEVPANPEK